MFDVQNHIRRRLSWFRKRWWQNHWVDYFQRS